MCRRRSRPHTPHPRFLRRYSLTNEQKGQRAGKPLQDQNHLGRILQGEGSFKGFFQGHFCDCQVGGETDADLPILKCERAVVRRETRLVPALSTPDAAALDVKGVVVLQLKVRLLQEKPGLVGVGFALVDAKGSTVATLVAKVVHMHDLPCLANLESFRSSDDQVTVLAGHHGQPPAHRRDEVAIVGTVWADFDALVAKGRALQAAFGFGAGGFFAQRQLDQVKPGALLDGEQGGLMGLRFGGPHPLDLKDVGIDDALDALSVQTGASIYYGTDLYKYDPPIVTVRARGEDLETVLRGMAKDLEASLCVEKDGILISNHAEWIPQLAMAAYDVSTLLTAGEEGHKAMDAGELIKLIKRDLSPEACRKGTWLRIHYGKLLVRNTSRVVDEVEKWLGRKFKQLEQKSVP